MADLKEDKSDNPSPSKTAASDMISGDKVFGDKVGGDKVAGDKIGRDKNEYHFHTYQSGSPPKPKLPFEPETVPIPAGPFLMGSDRDSPYEAPQRQIELPDYYIGRFPITNEQYAHYLWQSSEVAPSTLLWNGNTPPEDRLNHPVTGVTWEEALQYCRWLSEQSGRTYSLPSEAHWEKAARTTDGRRFPWGDEWQNGRCHQGPDTAAVDAYPAQNEYGCFDLAGGAREWTSTLWGQSPNAPDKAYQYPWANDRREDKSAPPSLRRIYRGGWAEQVDGYRCSARGSFLPDKPGPRRHRHGFRVLLLPT